MFRIDALIREIETLSEGRLTSTPLCGAENVTVRVPGALLQMGDVHATMGDAELCGTGIEIAAQITVGLCLFPTSFWITSTGRTPPCSEPTTGLRSA